MSVRAYLHEQLTALGPGEEHTFDEGREEGVNLILRLPGQQPKLDPLLVGAHYDGPLESIVADDNATGVAALLVLAQRWAADLPRRPVWLVAYRFAEACGNDQEEWGVLGSKTLACDLRQGGQKLRLMVSLEMLGYTAENQPAGSERPSWRQSSTASAFCCAVIRCHDVVRFVIDGQSGGMV